jgi:hypothetical protein
MAAAADASTRLLNALQQLQGELQSAAQGTPRARRYLEKREAAVEALTRHAQFIMSQFAFIDGARVDAADARLLGVFYADPLECVASRYCWALLRGGRQAASLPGIIAATRAEYEAFTSMQASESGPEPPPTAETEHAYRQRADRTGYILSVLRRVLIVQRQIGGSASPATRTLESEVVSALEAAEVSAAILREIRRTRMTQRGGHAADG